MSGHLGKIELENTTLYENCTIFNEYIDKLIFSFNDYSIDVYQVYDFTLNYDKSIIIELTLFNPFLYNAYVMGEKIKILTEIGQYADVTDLQTTFLYNTTYYNYYIKSAHGSKTGRWIYILAPFEE